MNYYKVYGLRVRTDLVFPQLIEYDGAEAEADEDVNAGKIPASIVNRQEQKCRYEFGDEVSWLENDTCYLLVEKGDRIIYFLKPGMREDYLKTYILGWGMSMLALQRGILAMHCSVVTDNEGAILICGESGSGKSTITSAFLDAGYGFMADDIAFVETQPGQKAIVYPTFPYQKLCRDAAMNKGYSLEEMIYIDEDKDKFLVPFRGEFKSEAVPVKGMIMLLVHQDQGLVDMDIIGMDSFRLVMNNLFLRHLLGENKYDPKIGQLGLRMAAAIKGALIARPEKGDTTKEVVEKAFEYVKKWSQ